MDDEELLEMYDWLDSIPLSREKKNTARDFSDGVLTAEILKFYFPKFVELHNYPSASSTKQKLSNWSTLNMKVFKKIKFKITQNEINDIIAAKPKAIEVILIRLFHLIVKKDSTTINLNNITTNKETANIEISKQIESIDKDIQNLLTRKETLEQNIKSIEEENESLQRQIEEVFAKIEAKLEIK